MAIPVEETSPALASASLVGAALASAPSALASVLIVGPGVGAGVGGVGGGGGDRSVSSLSLAEEQPGSLGKSILPSLWLSFPSEQARGGRGDLRDDDERGANHEGNPSAGVLRLRAFAVRGDMSQHGPHCRARNS